MAELDTEVAAFQGRKEKEMSDARAAAALQLSCGIDFFAALGASAPARLELCKRIERLLRRERLRGLQKHWSYDLNRHIALKQAHDRLARKTRGGPRARL